MAEAYLEPSRTSTMKLFCGESILDIFNMLLRSTHQRGSVKKVFLKILQKSQKNICAKFPFLKKLQIAPGHYCQRCIQDTVKHPRCSNFSWWLLPAGNCMFKVNNRNTRARRKTCSALTIKTPERRQWRGSGGFIVNFQHISHIVPMFLLLTLSR